ncbi:MAG: thiol-disulfide isomerase/thioredoxin [Rhodothermales bacterium]
MILNTFSSLFMTEPKKEPWWKNGWVFGLALLGMLHLTGTAVHVQAGFQRVLLYTGLFHPDLVPKADRQAANLQFRLANEDGEVYSLTDFDGEVRFVNFWATWCAPCLAEMPAIAKLHADYGDKIHFSVVSMDDDFTTALAYMANQKFGINPVTRASAVPRSITSGAIPTTIILDRNGRIAVYEAGMADYNSARFRASLDRLLEEA